MRSTTKCAAADLPRTAYEASYAGTDPAAFTPWDELPDIGKAMWARVVRAVMEAGIKSGEMPGWRPIETAPKTNRAILVHCPERRNTYVVSWWDRHGEEPGWAHFGGYGNLTQEPTHWQPLPAAPDPKQDRSRNGETGGTDVRR